MQLALFVFLGVGLIYTVKKRIALLRKKTFYVRQFHFLDRLLNETLEFYDHKQIFPYMRGRNNILSSLQSTFRFRVEKCSIFFPKECMSNEEMLV